MKSSSRSCPFSFHLLWEVKEKKGKKRKKKNEENWIGVKEKTRHKINVQKCDILEKMSLKKKKAKRIGER